MEMKANVLTAAGHGGNDPGAVAAGKFVESAMALVVAFACCGELKKCSWINVRQARTSDINQSIATKVNMANSMGADLALDIHFNAGGGDGAEVWASIAGGTGDKLAENILKRFEEIGQNSRGVKKSTNASGSDYFGFIRMTKMPAVIVECGFIDNAKDRKLFDTDAELKKMGVAIAKGIVDTLEEMGFKNGSEAKSEPKRGYAGTFPTLPKRGYFANVDTGAQVKNLQRLLNWAAGTKLSVDGSVGPKTIAAVKTFQKKYGLSQDGLFGKSCLAKAKTIKK